MHIGLTSNACELLLYLPPVNITMKTEQEVKGHSSKDTWPTAEGVGLMMDTTPEQRRCHGPSTRLRACYT